MEDTFDFIVIITLRYVLCQYFNTECLSFEIAGQQIPIMAWDHPVFHNSDFKNFQNFDNEKNVAVIIFLELNCRKGLQQTAAVIVCHREDLIGEDKQVSTYFVLCKFGAL